MKKYIISIALLFAVLFSYGQSSHGVETWRSNKTYTTNKLVSKDGVIYKALVQTTETPPHADWEAYASGSYNPNNQHNINSNYTTLAADDDKKGIVLGGDITLDDTGITAGYQQTFVNNSSVDVTIDLAAGQNTLNGQASTFTIPQGFYAYVELIADNVWSVIVDSEGAAELQVHNVDSNYTPSQDENQNMVYASGGTTLTLDDSSLNVGFNQTFYNSTGGDITISSADNIEGGTTIPDGTWAAYVLQSSGNWIVSVQTSGGGGSVDSVNGQTGVVVLDADDIDDSNTTNKFATQTQLDQINTNEGNITTNSSDIATNASDIGTLNTSKIGGSIGNNQIAFGSGTDITGSNDLTYDGDALYVNDTINVGDDKVINLYDTTLNTGLQLQGARIVYSIDQVGNWAIPAFRVHNSNDIRIAEIGFFGFNSSLHYGYLGVDYSNTSLKFFGGDGVVVNSSGASRTELGSDNFRVNGSSYFDGTIKVEDDPTIGKHVGNRDYNDGRYSQLSAQNTFTGTLNSFKNLSLTGDAVSGYSQITLSNPVNNHISTMSGNQNNLFIGSNGVVLYIGLNNQVSILNDPTTGDGIGNRDYNDGRYAQLSNDNVFTGQVTINHGLGNTLETNQESPSTSGVYLLGAPNNMSGHVLNTDGSVVDNGELVANIATTENLYALGFEPENTTNFSVATTSVENNKWYEVNHATTDITITLDQGVKGRVAYFEQTGDAQGIFTAGSGVILTHTLSVTTPKTREKGAVVAAIWKTATKVHLVGGLEDN